MSSSVLRAVTIQSLLKPRAHPLDPSRVRHTVSLGDETGITKTGIHKTTLEPGMKSTVEHFHDVEEEWVYILEGSGMLLRAGVGEDTPLAVGDFVGWSTAEGHHGQPHALQAGAEGISYLCGGSRQPVDFCHYPLIKKGLLINRAPSGTALKFVDEE
ncbi:cupin domain-containing protein [Roridomyces roridus]|uniref:Cupin domain-containing protein n=1 Tax=Roridomyces roridus TaxID=1738132 RepID=A0AAD7CKF4_9AGAR|nr:cupin domain-containing protein [Roridomyces roridus]KAJ7649792.1 cupin domain-containing protein [Roridomyces roridus]